MEYHTVDIKDSTQVKQKYQESNTVVPQMKYTTSTSEAFKVGEGEEKEEEGEPFWSEILFRAGQSFCSGFELTYK